MATGQASANLGLPLFQYGHKGGQFFTGLPLGTGGQGQQLMVGNLALHRAVNLGRRAGEVKMIESGGPLERRQAGGQPRKWAPF